MSLDQQILRTLRESPSGVSGAEMATRLQVTRAAIWARMEELRRLGYQIEATPHSGYRLVGTPDALHADDLMARLGSTHVVGRSIQVYEQTASTNDVLDRLARDGAPEGVAVFAEAQTRGRGRLGRVWESPPRQGLWFSVLLRPGLPPHCMTQLTVMGAVAVRQAVKAVTNLSPEIKWPNDLLLRGRKFAGILTEMNAEPDRVRYVVLGIGVDVNQGDHEMAVLPETATSLRRETGIRWDRAQLAVAVLRALDETYDQLRGGWFSALAEEWARVCTTIGRTVTIRAGTRTWHGRAESLDRDGALLVRSEHGHLERVTGGDVTVEK
jgi:BirA family biotin operon repressor/biotin-[acetyl-CoA-carboxylase] ligase